MKKRKPTILSQEKSDNHIILELHVDSDITDFEGHFAHFSLLPGVTQIDWALNYAIEYLNTPPAFKGMEVIKFQEPILPNSTVFLSLSWDKNKQKLMFSYHSKNKTTTHSSGKMRLGDKSE